MAKPELKDGFTQIANEVMEHLALLHLRPDDWRVLIFILRKTYGFHKRVDYISNSQMVKGVGLHKSTISHCLKRLHTRRLIIRRGKLVGFQKDWEEWLPESPTNRKLEVLPTVLEKTPTKVESPPVTQNIKENIQNKSLRDANSLTPQIREVFRELKKRNWDTPSRAKEAKAIKWMLSKGYTPSAILITYDALKGETFWCRRFLSMVKVAEQIGEKGNLSGRKIQRRLPEVYTPSPDYPDG